MPKAQTSPHVSPTASFLAADFGNVNTRVVLMDVVEGSYRLVARGTAETTLAYPFNDVGVGLTRVLKTIAKVTGRTLLDDDNQLITPEDNNRRGVDYFLATASAGQPLRAIVVGVLPDVSIASAMRAIAGTYVEPVATFHIKDGRDESDHLNTILSQLPDLILIAGGTDGGATESIKKMVASIKLALQILDPTRRPLVLYAGNKDLVPWMHNTFEGISNVLVADNLRPSMNSEALDTVLTRLAQAYEQHKEQYSAPYKGVSAVSAGGVQPSAISYTLITEYLAKTRQQNVLMLDIGSATTTVIGAFNGDIDTSISTTMGLGHSAPSLIEQVGGADAIKAWLPFEISRLDIHNYALNKSLRPASVPATPQETYLEHAFLRVGLRHAIAQARPTWRGVDAKGLLPNIGLIVASGAGLTQTGNTALTMQLIADIVQPIGITEIKADTNALITALGAIARINPSAVVQLLDGNNLDHLGTLISGQGTLAPGKPAVKLKITMQDGEIYEHTINGGEMWLLPLRTGRELALDIRCVRGVTIDRHRRIKRTFYGGMGGILFDMRGRPFTAGLATSLRAQNLPAWLSQAIGEEVDAIPQSWLDPVEESPDVITITMPDEDTDDGSLGVYVPARRKSKKKGQTGKLPSTGRLPSTGQLPSTDELAQREDDEFARLMEEEEDDLDDLRKLL